MNKVQLGDKRTATIEKGDKACLKAVLRYAGTIRAAAELMSVDRNKLAKWVQPGKQTCHPDTLQEIRKFFDENPEIIGQAATA